MPLGRNGLIGMAVAGTAGLGLIALIVYREVRRRRSQRVALVTGRTSRLLDTAELAALLRENHDPLGQGGCHTAAAAAAAAFTLTRVRLLATHHTCCDVLPGLVPIARFSGHVWVW